MTKCYICEKEINKDNETEEHVLLNAIGGILKSKTLICKKCNSKLGDEIDSELARQLNYLSNLLNIKRDRKPVPNLDAKANSTGEPILLQPGGKPIMKRPIKYENINEKNQIKISIKAPTVNQAKKMLTGLKRKYNQIDVDKALSEANIEQRYLNETYKIPIVIESDKLFRSICKMAINLYMLKCGTKKYIQNLIPYILGKEDSNCVQYYYKNSDIILKKENEMLHSIIIKGIKNDKLLLAYIELFNCYKFVVKLNDYYDGDDINITYYFDVLQRKEINKHNTFFVSKNEILRLVKDSKIPTNQIIAEIQNVLNFAYKKQEDEYILNALEKARKNSFDKHSEDQVYTDEMGNEFIDELMKQITPWLAHKIKHNKN